MEKEAYMSDRVDPKLKADKELEDEAKRMGDYELHPLVGKVHQKFGAFNLIRNARNARQVEITKASDY